MAKIVVVEDDAQIRGLIEAILAAEGYAVVATGDPTQALDIVRREQPNLVLCDIAMPVMDGYGVLRALQMDPATAQFPVVFLTAHREFSERVKAFRYGVVDYLAKPFSRQVLVSKVQRVLDGLARRSGVMETDGGDASEVLLEEVQRDARTGVITVKSDEGDTRLVLRAGELMAGTSAPRAPRSAAFQELDPTRDEVLAHDPPALPGSEAAAPAFEALPEMVRDVLIVDDNAAFRRFLRAMLVAQGFVVHEAADGESALSEALERRPWLIVSDVSMPGMDGFELCRRVRAHSLIRQTPFLFLSGWDDYKQRYQGLELGADDFISKGTPLRELFIRIQLIMQRYRNLGGRGRGAGMEGQVQIVGAPGILQMCHLGRLSGLLSAQDGPRRLAIAFREGEIVKAESADQHAEHAVYEFLAWERGRFEFAPGDPGPGSPLPGTFDQLLLEGCRLQDERRNTAPGH